MILEDDFTDICDELFDTFDSLYSTQLKGDDAQKYKILKRKDITELIQRYDHYMIEYDDLALFFHGYDGDHQDEYMIEGCVNKKPVDISHYMIPSLRS